MSNLKPSHSCTEAAHFNPDTKLGIPIIHPAEREHTSNQVLEKYGEMQLEISDALSRAEAANLEAQVAHSRAEDAQAKSYELAAELDRARQLVGGP